MTDQEKQKKTIRGLEICKADLWSRETCKITGCPYADIPDGTTEYKSCRIKMMTDALSLLKAQKPRVMTLEEAQKWAETPLESRDPVFYEDRTLERAWWIWNADDRRTYLPAIIGGIGRFWTSRPTDEQRKAVKWE